MIAALGKGRVIGKKNDLLWRIPDDLRRVKELTTNHSIIMGDNTYRSIGKPLPNRHTIVMTLDKNLKIDGVTIVHSPEEALEAAKGDEAFIFGGAQIYKLMMPYADKLYLTLIEDEKEGDVFFPDYSAFIKKETVGEGEWNGIKYSWVNFSRT